MAALTSEEITYAPVINNEGVTDTKRGTMNRLHVVLCIVLVINVVIQFIAVVTPGWSIVTSETLSAYESVYYSTVCVKYVSVNETVSECETLSFHDRFRQNYNKATDAGKPAEVRAYNFVVQYQLNIQIAWLLVVGTIIFQVFKLTRPNEGYPRLTIINVIAVTCACPLMFQILFKNFVEIDFIRRISEFLTRDVGFPYSFFLYVFTCIMTVASLILIVKQVYDHIREKDRIYAEMKVKFDRLQLEYEAEVEAFKRFRRNTHLRPDIGGSYRGDRRSKGDDRGSHFPRHSQEIRDGTHTAPYDKSREHSPRRPDNYSSSRDHSPPRHTDRDNLHRNSPRPWDRSPHGEQSYRDHSPRHSPRPRGRSPPGEHSYRDRSPRHSPRLRDRSPHGEHSYRDHSPRHSPRLRDRSPPGEHSYRDHSPRHSPRPRNRSPPREDVSRRFSPPLEDRGNHLSRNRSPPQEDRGNNSLQNSGEQDNPALVITPPTEAHSSDTPGFDLTPQVDANKDVELENGAKTEDIELTITKI